MTLADEINNGPLASILAPHVATGNDAAIYAALTAKNISALGVIPKNTFAVWAAKTGQRATIEDTASSTGDPCRSIAIALQDLLKGNLDTGLDLSVSDTVSMMNTWLSNGKMSQQVADTLLALATVNISRADQLPGLVISIETIASALGR